MGHYTGSVPETAEGPHDWMARMACRNEDPDLFTDKATSHDARLICVVRCPVRQQCLANVKHLERGSGREARDGVVAGLLHYERYRQDPHVRRGDDDPALLSLDGTEPCGSYNALLGHLWRGERVDPECWSAEVRRERLERTSTVAKRAAAVVEPAPPPALPALAPRRPKPPTTGRTPKERHVYRLWARGLPDLDIARRADLSTPAVRRIREGLHLLPNTTDKKAS